MTGKQTVYSFDSNLIIAWFRGEEDKPLDAIGQVIDEIESGKASLVVSAITLAEVLELDPDDQAATDYKLFLKRDNIVVRDVDQNVIELTSTFRTRSILANRKLEGDPDRTPKLRTVDAIVAATASLCEVTELLSTDPDLWRLDGSGIVDGLRIKKLDRLALNGDEKNQGSLF